MGQPPKRYELVSRRAMLKAAAGFGLVVVVPAACGNSDIEVFAGALTDVAVDPTAVPEAAATDEVAVGPTAVPEPTPTAAPVEPTAVPAQIGQTAVDGEMVIAFTYTRGAVGEIERPYIAVWIENAAGELAETVALWYEQGRRGARWLDHLNRWYPVDQDRILSGGVDDSVTISSATREPGSHSVAWDGNIDGVPAAAGLYYVCIESAREHGPNSLIREPFQLAGSLAQTGLPAIGELSAASVRINV